MEYESMVKEKSVGGNYFNEIVHISDLVIKQAIFGTEPIKCVVRLSQYDRALFNHSVNVALLSLVVGIIKYKNLKKHSELFTAALLHDYGKIFISKEILQKPGTLTKEEWKQIEQHSIIGYIYLKQYTCLSGNILYGVLDHHEKINGSGYMLCKDGNNISEYAKIIAIADVYDSMTSDRVYRKKLTKKAAIEYLQINKGKHLDAALTEMFLDFILNINEDEMESIEIQFMQHMKLLIE